MDPIEPPKLRLCRKCNIEKPESAFSPLPDGIRYTCKRCGSAASRAWAQRNPEKAALTKRMWNLRHGKAYGVKRRKWEKDNPELAQNIYLKYTYGLPPGSFEKMKIAQEGRCAICGVIPSKLCVDHNHSTGQVRDLLCHRCNAGIGFLQDNPEILRAATQYLEKHFKLAQTIPASSLPGG